MLTKKFLQLNANVSITKKCKHIKAELYAIYSKFENSFFHPNYENILIEDYLKEYGLTLDNDYEKYFEFTIDGKGFSATKTYKN